MTQTMRMLFMIYDADFDEDVMASLEDCGAAAYTKWGRVLGKGRESEPRLDDAVWPGFNCALTVAVEDALADGLFNAMEKLAEKLGSTGFKVFELPVLRVI